jgi:Lon protease-like protein
MALIDIPLFPLSTVLFPGALLPLRIFEPRYLDLVRDCARSGSGFGICLMLDAVTEGGGASPAAVGTFARIQDFGSLPDGLLCITVLGGERFRVNSIRVRDNGLIHGEVRFWPEEGVVALPPECGLLAEILERLLDRVGCEWADAPRACYGDAVWVGFRLAEALPLAMHERQQLLEMTDPLARLQQLLHYLPRFQH